MNVQNTNGKSLFVLLSSCMLLNYSLASDSTLYGFGDCTQNGVFLNCKALNSNQYNSYTQQNAIKPTPTTNQNSSNNPVVSTPTTPLVQSPAIRIGQVPVIQMQYKYYLEDRVVSCQSLYGKPGFGWVSAPNPELLKREGETISYMGYTNGVISAGYIQDMFTIFQSKSANDYSYNSGSQVVYGGAIEERSVQKDQAGNVISAGEWYIAKTGFCKN